MDHEGHQVARWFTAHGVAAAIVKYRLGPRYRHPAPLQDVLRAIRVVRSRAAELGVKPDRIGVMGFSAGGHLASSAATLFDLADAKVADGLEAVSSRPDFAILGYPVIVFGADVTHKGSQRNLLGDDPAGGSGDAAVDRSPGHRADTADVPLSHQRRRRRAAAEQRRVLSRVEECRRPGRTAHLREGRARRGPCARRSRAVHVAGSDVGVDAGAGVAELTIAVRLHDCEVAQIARHDATRLNSERDRAPTRRLDRSSDASIERSALGARR